MSNLKKIQYSLTILILAAFSQGCSWILMDKPPDRELWSKVDYVECDTSKVAPIIDTVFAVSSAIGLLTTLGNDSDDGEGAVIGGAIGLGIWGGSALSGYNHSSDCKEFYDTLAKRKNRTELEQFQDDLRAANPELAPASEATR